MNTKKYFKWTIILNAAVITSATCLSQLPSKTHAADATTASGMSISAAKFGPAIEKFLPVGKSGQPELMNLETGGMKLHQRFEYFNFRADAIMRWIRSNGLDISCNVWKTGATCTTYDMTVVPVAGKCWDEITEEDLLNNPNLAPKAHSPRRLLVLGQNHPDTYVFRTGEGTLGKLQIVGFTQRGVNLRYKLISATTSLCAANS